MRIRDALAGVSQLYIDTAPFIYFTENRAGHVAKMRAIFTEIHQGVCMP